jgi:metal-responsive CopG/Arc/MetJ family transcriptional regulator
MPRPISTYTVARFRIPKSLLEDIDNVRWELRKEKDELVTEAIIEYIANHAPKRAK